MPVRPEQQRGASPAAGEGGRHAPGGEEAATRPELEQRGLAAEAAPWAVNKEYK